MWALHRQQPKTQETPDAPERGLGLWLLIPFRPHYSSLGIFKACTCQSTQHTQWPLAGDGTLSHLCKLAPSNPEVSNKGRARLSQASLGYLAVTTVGAWPGRVPYRLIWGSASQAHLSPETEHRNSEVCSSDCAPRNMSSKKRSMSELKEGPCPIKFRKCCVDSN